jgi:RNA polymerase sigma factor (sigma-70 family)
MSAKQTVDPDLAKKIGDCHPLVLNQCMSWFKGHPNRVDLAEDAAQESILRALVHSSGFRGECGLTSWVYAVTRSQLLTKYRTKSRLRKYVFVELPLMEEILRYDQDFPDHFELGFWSRKLDCLTVPQVKAVHLKALGHTFREMSVLLRISPATAKTRYYGAMRKMKVSVHN